MEPGLPAARRLPSSAQLKLVGADGNKIAGQTAGNLTRQSSAPISKPNSEGAGRRVEKKKVERDKSASEQHKRFRAVSKTTHLVV